MTSLQKVMLAAKPKPDQIDAVIDTKLCYDGLCGQLKLDGIRVTVQQGKLYTRALKLVPNAAMQRLWGREELEGLDGEIIVGDPTAKDCFHHSQSIVMSRDKPMTGAVFYVFDMLDDQEPFCIRNANAKYTLDKTNVPGIKHLPYTTLKNAASLRKFEDAARSKGHEGIVVRLLSSSYKHGRSTLVDQWLVAVKRTVEAEAVVLDTYEQMENTNEQKLNELGKMRRSSHKAGKRGKGTLGGFVVMMLNDKVTAKVAQKLYTIDPEHPYVFGVGGGPGLTDALRKELWQKRSKLPGKLIKIRYQGVGTVDLPRQPQFLGFRDRRDL